MSRMVTPNELQTAAEKFMLDGRKPKTREDWARCANFWAGNAARGLELEVTKLMHLIFESPLEDRDIELIAAYQQSRKVGKPQ